MFSALKLVFIVTILIVSILFANLAFHLDLDLSNKSKYSDEIHPNADLQITNTSSHLMWFLQISDLHLSIFKDRSRIVEFEDFCSKTVDVVNPAVVLASGDLTDAKHKNNLGSSQFKEEWMIYNNVLNKYNIQNKTLWLDIRGNHDNFDVPGWKSMYNYFKEYSIQGIKNPRSYMHIIKQGIEKYAFIGVDACLEPGLRRPLNFIGLLTEEEIVNIKEFIKRAKAENVTSIVWFGHYPSSCVISFDEHLRELIGSARESQVYMCGHLHTIAGLVKEMYTLQRQGYLELELGDWKDNRIFRLAAIDHGLFSFVDYKHGTWPVTLITNPKHALYAIPGREPLSSMAKSTHVRIITFSLVKIDSVQVKIDDGEWNNCDHISGPLYTYPWNPSKYNTGLHTISVKVLDVQGRQTITEQPFSLDGSRLSFSLLAKTTLMLDFSTVFQCLFGMIIITCVVPITYLRWTHHCILIGKSPGWNLKKKSNKWLRRFWLLSTVDSLFYPLVLYSIYLCFGPWFVGEIMEDHTGIVFAWGTIMNGAYIPGTFTYIYGYFQMLIIQLPMMFILAKCVDERFLLHWGGIIKRRSLCKSILNNLPFIIVLSMQMLLAYFFYLAYGPMAFLIGPMRTWSVFMNVYLWIKSTSLTSKSTKEAACIWMGDDVQFKNLMQ